MCPLWLQHGTCGGAGKEPQRLDRSAMGIKCFAMSSIFPLPHSPRTSGPYTATAAQTDFPGTFPIQYDADVRVERTRLAVTSTLVLDTDYEVISAGDAAGFTIRLLPGHESLAGDTIDIAGAAVIERTTSVVQAGQFNSRQMDRELDRSRIIEMELARRIDDLAQTDVTAAVAAAQAAAAQAAVTLDAIEAVGVDPAGYLSKSGNLSGLTDVPVARTNLGLGAAALKAVGTAVGNLVEVLTGGKLPVLDGSNLTNLPISNEINDLVLASDSVVSTTTFADVSGMSFAALANSIYIVELTGSFNTAVAATGIGLALNIPSGAVHGIAQAITVNSSTVIEPIGQQSDDAVMATTSTGGSGSAYPIIGRWVVAVGGTAGTIQLRQKSEVAASDTTLRANTVLSWRKKP